MAVEEINWEDVPTTDIVDYAYDLFKNRYYDWLRPNSFICKIVKHEEDEVELSFQYRLTMNIDNLYEGFEHLLEELEEEWATLTHHLVIFVMIAVWS